MNVIRHFHEDPQFHVPRMRRYEALAAVRNLSPLREVHLMIDDLAEQLEATLGHDRCEIAPG
jgi:hypothetical protein